MTMLRALFVAALLASAISGCQTGYTLNLPNDYESRSRMAFEFEEDKDRPFKAIVDVLDLADQPAGARPTMIREMQRSIEKLHEPLTFTVLVATPDGVLECPPFGLKPATAAMKKTAQDWLTQLPVGPRADAASAMKLALHYEPDLMYLLSADFKRFIPPTVAESLESSNPNLRINVIQFVSDSNADYVESFAKQWCGRARIGVK
mgnify:CR=1 FL=1